MGNIFSGSEVAALAVIIEKNGFDFYRALAQKTTSDNVKKIFLFLAGEEEKHIVIFEKLTRSLASIDPAESYQGEYAAYMQGLADEHIFTKQGQGQLLAGDMHSDAAALEQGMMLEEDSIVFYAGLKKAVPAHEQKTVEEVIAEEEKHLKMLIDLKKII